MQIISFDTETHLMRPCLLAPPMVTFQFRLEEHGKDEIIHARDPILPTFISNMLKTARWNGHNIAFDMAVIAAWEPDLLPEIFQAYADDRVTDTGIRQKLYDLSRGEFTFYFKQKGGYSLAACAKRMAGVELDKTDPWRTKYGTLYDTPISDFPSEALSYALKDAEAQSKLFFAQEKSIPKAVLKDQYRQTRAAWWLHLAGVWGMRTDLAQVEKMHANTLQQLRTDRELLLREGLVNTLGTKNTKAAMRRIVSAFESLDEQPLLTDAGQKVQEALRRDGVEMTPSQIFKLHENYIVLDNDACLASGDDTMEAYSRYGSARTLLSRVDRLYAGTKYIIQPRFNELVETGRTSASQGEDPKDGSCPIQYGFQVQNVPKKEGARECFIPRPGFLYVSVDYDAFELSTWAQVCLWVCGYSNLARVLNDGKDPHAELGARLARLPVEEVYAILRGERGKEAQKAFKSTFRQTAKIGNFGFPGGMGADALRTQARVLYRVFLTKPEVIILRNEWRATWPEEADYFRWVNSHLDRWKKDAKGTAVSFRSERIRARVGFTQIANNPFQGLAADAAKDAGFRVSREMYTDKTSALYGSRIVVFAHDEIIAEVPENQAHDAAYRLRDVMVETAREWIPDVKVSASPALMRRWSKAAEPAFDKNGRLIPFEDAA